MILLISAVRFLGTCEPHPWGLLSIFPSMVKLMLISITFIRMPVCIAPSLRADLHLYSTNLNTALLFVSLEFPAHAKLSSLVLA